MRDSLLRPIFIFLFLFVNISVYSQKTLSGIIKNAENGEPLPYATIKIKDTSRGTISNIEGHFTLLNVEGDTVVLEASYVGFYFQEFTIALSGEPLIELRLTPHTTQLDELVITADSYQIMNASEGLSYVKLSPKDISLMPSLGEEDIFRSLQLMPGVSGTNENSSGLYVRGGTPDQNLVTYDGMTVYHVDHFFGFFSAFNPDAIKDVQFYRGAFPAKYGGRTSGVIDLTGRAGSLDEVEVNAGVNLLSSRLTLNLPVRHKASILISGRRSYSDFLESGLYKKIYDLIDSGSPNGNPQLDQLDPNFTPISHFYDINAKVSYRPTQKDNITFTFYNGRDFLDKSRDIEQIVGAAGINRYLRIGIDDNTNWGNSGVSLRWARQWNPKFFSNALVTYSKYFSDFDYGFTFDLSDYATDSALLHAEFSALERNRVQDFSYGLDNEWLLTEHHKLNLGFLSKYYDLNYKFTRDDSVTIFERAQNANETAGYLQDTWKIGNNVQVVAGLRGVYYDLLDEFYLEPRLSIEYTFLKNWKLKAGWGKFNQFVNRVINENVTSGSRDFFLLSDNDVLNANKSEHYILGGSFEKEDWLLDAEFFRKDMEGLSEFSLRFQRAEDIDISKLFFHGGGVAKGAEFLIQKKTGNYRAWISYTISRVEHTFPDLNGGESFPALHDQSHEIKTVHIYTTGAWSFGATFVYGSGKPFTRPESLYQLTLLDGRDLNYIHVGAKNTLRLPAYHRLDISAHYTIKVEQSEVVLGLSVFNLYNHKNVWYKEFDATDLPIKETNINYLGITPNVSLSFKL